jgi:Domain of unknown function (DUF4386)
MTQARNPGRVAGLWYLGLTLLGPIRLLYVPGRLFTTENASTIVQNIAAHPRLFGVGIAAELAGGVVLVFLTLAFYRLFKDVSWNAAALVMIFGGVMPAVIDFFNAALDLQALEIARGAQFLSAVDKTHQDAIASLMISLGNHSNTAAELLWGLWLFPLGWLVYKSPFPAAISGRLALRKRLRLHRGLVRRHLCAAISGQSVQRVVPDSARRDRADALACDSRREAAGDLRGCRKPGILELSTMMNVRA